jgi:hypothetical protein
MNDPSIAVAMLGAGSRPARRVTSHAREPWHIAVRRWCAAWLAGTQRPSMGRTDGHADGSSDGRA